MNKRPVFDDPNPTVSDPVHGVHVDGFSGPEPTEATGTPSTVERCDNAASGWTCTRPMGHEGPCAAEPDRPAGMAAEELNHGAAVLFDATKRRMVILLSTLVQMAESGDFALWCPLSAMDEQFRSLDWTSVPPLAVAKFYTLVATTLGTYSARLNAHALAVLQAVKDGAALPEVPVWTGEDTVEMYDRVEQVFAPPAEVPTETPAAETKDGEQ